jgi:hypothetical protein
MQMMDLGQSRGMPYICRPHANANAMTSWDEYAVLERVMGDDVARDRDIVGDACKAFRLTRRRLTAHRIRASVGDLSAEAAWDFHITALAWIVPPEPLCLFCERAERCLERVSQKGTIPLRSHESVSAAWCHQCRNGSR